MKYEHLASNPAIGLIRELRDDTNPACADPEPNPLTAAEAEAFLTWLQTGLVVGVDRPVDGPSGRRGAPEWYPYFFALLRTGMRRGEAAALKWSAIYLDRTPPRARLELNYSPAARAAAPTTSGDITLKTKKAHEIDLAPALVDLLRELARTRRADALAAGRRVSPYVFVTPRGARMLSTSRTADRIFDRGMQALGLESCAHTIHDLRDTFATLHLLKDPGRLFWVSWMLGHRQTSTTLNRYTKWVPAQTVGHTFAGDLDQPTLGAKVFAREEAAEGGEDERQ